jgi:thiol-disulfide isomerase/thioredoxin
MKPFEQLSGRLTTDRRRFLSRAAMAMAAAQFGGLGAQANGRVSRKLGAFDRATQWLNSPPLTAAHLLEKVVVVDFCTYTCINWLRTLPYVRAWARTYQSQLIVIGVHTPEFAFERNVDNVRRAVEKLRIEYPIVIDSDYAIWRAFANQYWPALYFVDARGRVRQHHFGEGEYQTSERTVQRLLKEAGVADVGEGVVSADGSGFEAPPDWANLRSPESYVGYARMENFASRDAVKSDRARTYRAPSRLALNQWSLGGEWTIGR